jgi:hypothetical protein
MVSKNRDQIDQVNKLDSKHFLNKVKDASELADKALQHHGEPTISLMELRIELDHQLQGISLSNVVLNDRDIR